MAKVEINKISETMFFVSWESIRFATDRAGLRQLGKALLEAAGESDQLTLSEVYGSIEIK